MAENTNQKNAKADAAVERMHQQNQAWLDKQRATQADHEKLCKAVEKVVKEERKR